MAPQDSQDIIRELVRPEYEEWIAKFSHVQPLDTKNLRAAFDRWDADVGAQS